MTPDRISSESALAGLFWRPGAGQECPSAPEFPGVPFPCCLSLVVIPSAYHVAGMIVMVRRLFLGPKEAGTHCCAVLCLSSKMFRWHLLSSSMLTPTQTGSSSVFSCLVGWPTVRVRRSGPLDGRKARQQSWQRHIPVKVLLPRSRVPACCGWHDASERASSSKKTKKNKKKKKEKTKKQEKGKKRRKTTQNYRKIKRRNKKISRCRRPPPGPRRRRGPARTFGVDLLPRGGCPHYPPLGR